MKTKKIAIIGKGTAGGMSASFFTKHRNDFENNIEIDWYFDSNIPTQAVGEGADLLFSRYCNGLFNFSYHDMDKIDATFKGGIMKKNWGNNKKDFMHNFLPPNIAFHFNATALQNFIVEQIGSKVNIIEKNITADEIDADYVIDCSGRPKQIDDENFIRSNFIPVNAVHVTQCFWDKPRFQYTIAEAVPHGWVFLIPLQNRCSVGYLYNHNISSLKEIQNDVLHIFKKYNLIPSELKNSFYFDNYYRLKNYSDRVIYNGNASFFLEPLEATSISSMIRCCLAAARVINSFSTPEEANNNYIKYMQACEDIIMMHYFAGSKYDTPFWKFAQERGAQCMQRAMEKSNFIDICSHSRNIKSVSDITTYMIENETIDDYGPWYVGSFYENIYGLGIEKKLFNLKPA